MVLKDRQAVYDLAASKEPIAGRVKEALDVIEGALDTYSPDNVSISFNGGKDCTVLLHLYAAALAHRTPPSTGPISAVYIPVPSPFAELEDFIRESALAYDLDLFTCSPKSGPPLPVESVTPGTATPKSCKPGEDSIVHTGLFRPVGAARGGEGMRRALHLYKEKYPHIEAILVGTRKTDPHATLTYRNRTDAGWPSFERVNPIINWTYSDVWAFLRRLDVSYCSLYDRGYTSLGSIYNTFPNPALRIHGGASSDTSLPSVTVVATSDALCIAETPAARQPKPAAEDDHFKNLTLVADNPEYTCSAESRIESTSHCRAPTTDPSCTIATPCPAESVLANGGSSTTPPVESTRYWPAYMLQDESLERAGRVSGAALRRDHM